MVSKATDGLAVVTMLRWKVVSLSTSTSNYHSYNRAHYRRQNASPQRPPRFHLVVTWFCLCFECSTGGHVDRTLTYLRITPPDAARLRHTTTTTIRPRVTKKIIPRLKKLKTLKSNKKISDNKTKNNPR